MLTSSDSSKIEYDKTDSEEIIIKLKEVLAYLRRINAENEEKLTNSPST